MWPIVLLILSNIFMAFAWYGHLHYKDRPLLMVILVSWLIALPEYCFQVPANRIGHYQFTAAQLKIMQEVISLFVFGVFSVLYFPRETLRWNYIVGFVLILLLTVILVFGVKSGSAAKDPSDPGSMPARPETPAA